MVGFLGNLSILYAKGIVVLGAIAGIKLDAVTHFNSFDCTDRHDCLREHGIQLFKNRIADPGRKTGHTACDHTAGGILIFDTGFEKGFCVGGSFFIRHTSSGLSDCFPVKVSG